MTNKWGVLSSLSAEWAILSNGTHGRRRLETWAENYPILAGHERPAQLVEYAIKAWNTEAGRHTLATLLLIAADDQFAARCALAVLTPGLHVKINRYRNWAVTHTTRESVTGWATLEDLYADAVASAWRGIHALTGTWQPDAHRILLDNYIGSDLHHKADQANLRHNHYVNNASELARRTFTPRTNPADELFELLTDAISAGNLTEVEADLIWRRHTQNETHPAAARRLGKGRNTAIATYRNALEQLHTHHQQATA